MVRMEIRKEVEEERGTTEGSSVVGMVEEEEEEEADDQASLTLRDLNQVPTEKPMKSQTERETGRGETEEGDEVLLVNLEGLLEEKVGSLEEEEEEEVEEGEVLLEGVRDPKIKGPETTSLTKYLPREVTGLDCQAF